MDARALLIALGLAGAAAETELGLHVDSTAERGYVTVVVGAAPHVTSATVTERGKAEPLMSGDLPAPQDGLRVQKIPRAARWRCDQLARTFEATGRTVAGRTVTASSFTVRTPSCRNRLVLHVPRRVEPDGEVAVRVRDTWGTGLTTGTACLRGLCRPVELADGQAETTVVLPAGERGHAQVVLEAPEQRVAAPVAVGVRPRRKAAGGPKLLLAGDSMMQSLDSIFADRVGDRGQVVSDVQIGSGLVFSNAKFSWRRRARRLARRHRPHATIVFLGTMDNGPMQPPGGSRVDCCGARWSEEYARRARSVMRAFAQHGAGQVIWITVPAARDRDRHPSGRAVNRALVSAARAVPGATLLRADRLFTPGYRYRASVDGVRVRQGDGIHLSLAGARMVTDVLLKRLSGLI